MSPAAARLRQQAEADLRLGFGRFDPPGRPAALVLHLHGGAFLADPDSRRGAVPRLLAEAGAVVVSIDYPTGAEHPFPEALNAAFDTLHSLGRHRAGWTGRKTGLFVAGEECGGNLAAALAMMARDQGSPILAGQILLSPMLDPLLATDSLRCAEAGAAGCRFADGWQRYLGTAGRAVHPYAAPSGASRLAGLPPALVLTADDDPLRDEALRYLARLREAGVPAQGGLLSGPSGWPAALDRPPPAECPCGAQALQHFRSFFDAHSTPAPLRAAQGQPI